MPRTALIGHTGFVGGELSRQRDFTAVFNSSNIESIRGQTFDRIVCAGVSAVKWLANKEPKQDWVSIQRLMECLSNVSAADFVLISTIDVYRQTAGLTENDAPSTEGLHAYGLHRLRLESFIAERFPGHAIVRLPALFGTGLKKNALYDLLHDNQIDQIPSNAVLQWYPTGHLGGDLDLIAASGLRIINIVTEPITMESIRDRFFPDARIGPRMSVPLAYDLRTIHASVLGGHDGYHLTAGQVLRDMEEFVMQERARR